MKVLLIDVDSKIPNLALMKLSAYHKAKGDKVYLNNGCGSSDIIYASIVFSRNKNKLNGLRYFYPNAEIRIGGSGYSLDSKLPNEVEFLKPDYSLYPEMDYSLGYTTRGCNRCCYFTVYFF